MPLIHKYNKLLDEAFGEREIVDRADEVAVAPDEPLLHTEGEELTSAQVDKPNLSQDTLLIARGDLLLDIEDAPYTLKSELPGIPDEAWTAFVRKMACAALTAVSASNELGMFAMKPRRLADLGMVNRLARSRAPSGRTVWVAVFTPPMTCDKFLNSPEAQYKTFSTSMRNYTKRINNGEIAKDPDMSMSGALAILHRAGPNGLKTWKDGDKFPATQEIYDKIEGIF